MKKVFPLLLALIFAAGSYSQNAPAGFDVSNYGVKIEPDKRVMVVLATLDAARVQSGPAEGSRLLNTKLSGAGTAFRARLDSDLAVPDDLRRKISSFITLYQRRRPNATDAEIVAPFVAMAYSLAPTPELSDPVVTTDLPGDLLDVLDFAPLVREFYRRSGISAKLDQYTKEYQAGSDKLRGSAREPQDRARSSARREVPGAARPPKAHAPMPLASSLDARVIRLPSASPQWGLGVRPRQAMAPRRPAHGALPSRWAPG